MKARNFFQILGFKSKPRRYGYRKSEHALDVGTLSYYRWQHPGELEKSIPQSLVDQYREFISEGDFCIDIGAHTGDATLPMAVAAGKSGKVLALEPNPYVYHVLEKNVRANREHTNITSILGAAAPEETFMEFEYSDSGFCNGGRHENLSVFQHGHVFKQTVFGVDLEKELDNDFAEWLPKLRFIKIDAEGYDFAIMKSIENVIRNYRPIVKAEVFTKTSVEYRQGILNLLESMDYEVYKIEEEPLQKGPRITLDNADEWRRYDIVGIPS